MKKRILFLLVLCISVLHFSYAEPVYSSWSEVAKFSAPEGYTVTGMLFPDHESYNEPHEGYLTGIIFAEKQEDQTGAIFYTRDGGETWGVFDKIFDNEAWEDISFNGITGYTTCEGHIYAWGKGILLRTTGSASYWSSVSIPEELEDKEIVSAAFHIVPVDEWNSTIYGVISDGKEFWYAESEGFSWTWTKSESIYKEIYEDRNGSPVLVGTEPVEVIGINQVVHQVGIEEHLADQECTNDHGFFAVGKGGQILVSTDNGTTWKETFRGKIETHIINKNLKDIEFTSIYFRGNEAVSKGENKYVDECFLSGIETGGNNVYFFRSTSGSTPMVAYNTATGAGHVFNSGAFTSIIYTRANNSYYAVSEKGEVVISEDKGETWKRIVNPENGINFTVTPQLVKYLAKNDGSIWISIPELTALFNEYQEENLFEFVNNSFGFITTYEWEFPNANPGISNNFDLEAVRYYKTGNQKAKLTVRGKVPGTEEEQVDTFEKTLTVRGSYTWETLTTNTSNTHTKIVFPEGQNNIGFSTTHLNDAQTRGSLYKTEDGGKTWNIILESESRNISEEEEPGKDEEEPIVVPGLLGLAFPTLEVGYISGASPNTDYGDIGGEFAELYFPQVWKTINGGEDWTQLDMSEFNENFYFLFDGTSTFSPGAYNDIHFWDESQGVVINKGFVFVTSDGGDSWAMGSVTSDTWNNVYQPMILDKIIFADESTLYGIGSKPDKMYDLDATQQVYKSTDKGLTWSLIYGDMTNGDYFSSVVFRNADEGIVFRYNADGETQAYLTVDGGGNWDVNSVGIQKAVLGSAFGGESLLYICGENDLLMSSTDGEVSWRSEAHASINESLYDICVTRTGVAFACGTNGFLKRYIPAMTADFEVEVDEENSIVNITNNAVGFITDIKWEVNGTTVSEVYDYNGFEIEEGPYTIKLTVSGINPSTDQLVQKEKEVKILDPNNISTDKLSSVFAVYPNPVVDHLNYTFNLSEVATVGITVTTVNGVSILAKEYVSLNAGEHIYTENVSAWSQGVYIIQLTIDGEVIESMKLVK